MEFTAASWPWAPLCLRYGGSEHGDVAGLPPGPHRKLSLELSAKRVTLAETGAQTGAWNDLLQTMLTKEEVNEDRPFSGTGLVSGRKGWCSQKLLDFGPRLPSHPLDCGPKKPEPGQQLPQPCPRKLRTHRVGRSADETG